MKRETVVVLDFGGQYNQLVARRVRECNVYCEIYSYKTDLEKIKAMNPKGIILTGGPNSCYEADSPTCNKELFELGIPVLGLCYGAQLMMHVLGGESAVIKSHHNVGGLPDFVDFKEIIEPLCDLFKDEVRKAGLELGIPERLVFRQPFPGPGLGIRIIGEVTAEKVRIVQDADFIYREEVDNAAAEYKKEHGEDPSWMPNQYFAALTNMRSVGVMGDFRTYDYAVALRAVKTIDFMTAESAEIPYAVLNRVMNRIINEVKGVNRVFYDLTSKPPGTIEFE